ncbi:MULTISPECIES: transposase [unclassified Moraxella]|uniref:transposase n=1 Tax=unclassified Moraxella TaxID=2685852 RepID=UPI00359CFFB4
MIAPLIYGNTMTSNLFETWFEQILLPCLDNQHEPSIIILDDARFHRIKHLQNIINQSTTDNTQAKKTHHLTAATLLA